MRIGQLTVCRRVLSVTLFCLTMGLETGCQSEPKAPPTLADRITQTHGLDNWRYQRALHGWLFVMMQSQDQLEAEFYYHVDTGRLRVQLPDKTVVVDDGRQTWVAPASSPLREARSTYVAWVRLVALPFRLKEPGGHLTLTGVQKMGKMEYLVGQADFPDGGPFGADHWCKVYADPQSYRLLAVAYGRRDAGVLDEPKAVTFYDFNRVGGTQIATEWKFWKWHASEGIYGWPLGGARLLNLEFVAPKPAIFEKPEGARPDRAGER